jgi:hypothetical protein
MNPLTGSPTIGTTCDGDGDTRVWDQIDRVEILAKQMVCLGASIDAFDRS